MFEMSKRRILSVAKNLHQGKENVERRGGDHYSNCKKPIEKRDRVKTFIGQFRGHESHYGRNKSRRLYLPATLNVNKMWKMYNQTQSKEYQVSYAYFHKIFSCHFNLGFGSPATDTCSYCERTKNRIKFATSQEVKVSCIRDLSVHKTRAKQFHLLMKEEPENTVSFCFDMQQVQNLPKLPIQEAYYSLQIAFYSFCVVNIDGKKPVFYTWNEVQSGRGSNEVGSALIHFLKNFDFHENVQKIRLFSDGCGGQNKNSHMLHMLMFWMFKFAPKSIKEIEYIFPVRGHSYLPADRIFGRLEKELRRHEKIVFPEDYNKIYSKFGTVREMKKDWPVYNLKNFLDVLKKIEGISEQKRIYIKKDIRQGKRHVSLRSEINYRISDTSKSFQSFLKRGKKLEQAKLEEDFNVHGITQDKGRAVNTLLQQAYGDRWYLEENFAWYFEVLRDQIITNPEPDANDEIGEECICLEGEEELVL